MSAVPVGYRTVRRTLFVDFFISFCLCGGDPQDPAVRRRCGVLSGGIGIALNMLLFFRKRFRKNKRQKGKTASISLPILNLGFQLYRAALLTIRSFSVYFPV